MIELLRFLVRTLENHSFEEAVKGLKIQVFISRNKQFVL